MFRRLPARSRLFPTLISLLVGAIYFLSRPSPYSPYDYTYRIASALLDLRLGLTEHPGGWLNELVPFGDMFYSVFPLGSVLTMLPLALVKKLFHTDLPFPGRWLAAFCAFATSYLAMRYAAEKGLRRSRQMMLAVFITLGNWSWCNLLFAGAWQLALGFAVIGEMGALYFSLVRRHPLLCGSFFALAFGNRSEIVLLAPFFLLFMHRQKSLTIRDMIAFCIVPFSLGVATLGYNVARFGSPIDFGYARIPGVLDEPWYKHGIFSWRAIPYNVEKMLFEGYRRSTSFPYVIPTGFGGSILLACPFLLLLLKPVRHLTSLPTLAWCAIGYLTLILWCHGNAGGWQFSYRYAMTLLPWIFVILVEKLDAERPRLLEWSLLSLSVLINAWAVVLFHWTSYVKP